MSRYKLRKATDQDHEAINQLYYRITGRKRSAAQYAWEWLENPAGESERWVICEESTGDVVAHHGLIPIRFNAWGTALLAGKTENTMVSPEHRNKFVYLSFEKKMFEEAKQRFDVFFTTAGRGAPGMIRKRLGYERTGWWTTYVLYASPRYILSRLAVTARLRRMGPFLLPVLSLGVAAYRALRIRMGQPGPASRMVKTLRFDEHKEEVEDFWRKNKSHFGLTPERSGAYLEWRFGRNPYNPYQLCLGYKEGQLNGYAVTRPGKAKTRNGVLRRMVIEDLVVAGNDRRLYERFLKELLSDPPECDLGVLRTVESEDALNAALRNRRFFPWRQQPSGEAGGAPFYAYAHGSAGPAKGWFVTEALSEGVIEE